MNQLITIALATGVALGAGLVSVGCSDSNSGGFVPGAPVDTSDIDGSYELTDDPANNSATTYTQDGGVYTVTYRTGTLTVGLAGEWVLDVTGTTNIPGAVDPVAARASNTFTSGSGYGVFQGAYSGTNADSGGFSESTSGSFRATYDPDTGILTADFEGSGSAGASFTGRLQFRYLQGSGTPAESEAESEVPTSVGTGRSSTPTTDGSGRGGATPTPSDDDDGLTVSRSAVQLSDPVFGRDGGAAKTIAALGIRDTATPKAVAPSDVSGYSAETQPVTGEQPGAALNVALPFAASTLPVESEVESPPRVIIYR